MAEAWDRWQEAAFLGWDGVASTEQMLFAPFACNYYSTTSNIYLPFTISPIHSSIYYQKTMPFYPPGTDALYAYLRNRGSRCTAI